MPISTLLPAALTIDEIVTRMRTHWLGLYQLIVILPHSNKIQGR